MRLQLYVCVWALLSVIDAPLSGYLLGFIQVIPDCSGSTILCFEVALSFSKVCNQKRRPYIMYLLTECFICCSISYDNVNDNKGYENYSIIFCLIHAGCIFFVAQNWQLITDHSFFTLHLFNQSRTVMHHQLFSLCCSSPMLEVSSFFRIFGGLENFRWQIWMPQVTA